MFRSLSEEPDCNSLVTTRGPLTTKLKRRYTTSDLRPSQYWLDIEAAAPTIGALYDEKVLIDGSTTAFVVLHLVTLIIKDGSLHGTDHHVE